MADQISIDIQLLQAVFGQLQQVQQLLGGISGGVAAMDQRTATATSSINKSFQGVNQVLGQVEGTADRALGNVVQDLLGPIARTTELENKLRDLNQRMTTTRSVREMSALKKEAAAVQQEINRIDARGVEQRVAGPTSSLRSMFGGLAAPIAGAFAVSGVMDFGSGVVKAAADAQAYSTALEVMLQNKTAADAMVAQVKEFAATTPFELPQVQAASQQLLAFGFDSTKVVPQLQTLGNVASALNQPIGDIAYLFGTAKVQGRLYTNDLMQFMNRGIPIVGELSKVMGVSEAQVKKLTEEGKVGFAELEQAMNNLGGAGGRFDGLMDRQSKTIGGTVSNLSDAWGQFKSDLGLSLAPVISSSIGMLQEALGGLRTAMGWVQEHGTLVKGVLIGVAGAMGIYTAALITNAAATFVATLRTGGLAAAMGVQAVITNVITAATTLWEVAQWAINVALTANPIGVIIMAIAALVGAIVWAWNESETFRAVVTGAMEGVKAAFMSVYEIGKAVFESLVDIVGGAWKQIKGVMTFDGDLIEQGVKQQFDGAQKLVQTLAGAPQKFVNDQMAGMAKGWQEGKASFVADKAAEAGHEAADEKRREMALTGAKPGVIDAKSANAAAGLLGAQPAPAAGAGDGKGVSVGGAGGGGDRNISMNVTINVPLKVERDVQASASQIADQVIGMLVNKLRDAEFALG